MPDSASLFVLRRLGMIRGVASERSPECSRCARRASSAAAGFVAVVAVTIWGEMHVADESPPAVALFLRIPSRCRLRAKGRVTRCPRRNDYPYDSTVPRRFRAARPPYSDPLAPHQRHLSSRRVW